MFSSVKEQGLRGGGTRGTLYPGPVGSGGGMKVRTLTFSVNQAQINGGFFPSAALVVLTSFPSKIFTNSK